MAVRTCFRPQGKGSWPGGQESCHHSWLDEDGRMASSSKRRPSSAKPGPAGKARTISSRRKETLPRQSKASTPARGQLPELSGDAPLESSPTALAMGTGPAPRRRATKAGGARAKTTRAAGRNSGTRKKSAVKAVVTPEPSTAVDAVPPIPPCTEFVVDASAIVEETTIEIGPPPGGDETPGSALMAPAVGAAGRWTPRPVQAKPGLVRGVARLLSMLRRWTGLRNQR